MIIARSIVLSALVGLIVGVPVAPKESFKRVACYKYINRTNIEAITDCNLVDTVIPPVTFLKDGTASAPTISVNFTCGQGASEQKCDAAQKSFMGAADRLSKVFKLQVPIAVQATFENFCVTENACGGSNGIILGSAGPSRLFVLQDDDGLDRLYPQAVVKQFQFPQHFEYAQYDITARFNADDQAGFFFPGTGQEINATLSDFEMVVTHELMHGLGSLSIWRNFTVDDNGTNVLLPQVQTSNNKADGSFTFVGFLESGLDRYMHVRGLTDSWVRTAQVIDALNHFNGQPPTQYSSDAAFVKAFMDNQTASQLAANCYQQAQTPQSYALINILPNYDFQGMYLETRLFPFNGGSSLSHPDFISYTYSDNFVMVFQSANGVTFEQKINETDNTEFGIGEKLRQTMEMIGYKSFKNPEGSGYVPKVPTWAV